VTRLAATLALAAVTATAWAADEPRDIGGMSIIGNDEAPRSLYVVPWKSAGPGDVASRPVQRMASDALSPVDPEVFRRRLELRGNSSH
jgi:hypothetical protein